MATNPTLLSMALCKDADKNTIPQTDAGTSGLFSEQYGWQAINSLPLSAGGIAPNRRDFNGVLNLLGGIAFMSQKGWQFEFDESQDYYAGCIVRDTVDGKLYEALNDVSASSTHPNADSTNWALRDLANILTPAITPAFNKRDVITTSGTYTAPVTGWYKITAKGAGGGGSSGQGTGTFAISGASGAEGGTTIAYASMTAGDMATVVVGAGGIGASPSGKIGGSGGDTSVTIAGNTYIAGGGQASTIFQYGGVGGSGTIRGASGTMGRHTYGTNASGTNGAGSGGGTGAVNAIDGGGGAGGGSLYNGAGYAGENGGDGYVWFEYFDTSLNP